MRKIVALPLSVVALFAGQHSGRAQDLPDVAQGLQPYVAYHGGELDQINTLNGALTVRIPLVSYPQKGSSLSLSYSVIFNSFGFEDVAWCMTSQGGPMDVIPHRNGCTNVIQTIPIALSYDPLRARVSLWINSFKAGAQAVQTFITHGRSRGAFSSSPPITPNTRWDSRQTEPIGRSMALGISSLPPVRLPTCRTLGILKMPTEAIQQHL